jgi:8-oxo-dGTP diphosphatase
MNNAITFEDFYNNRVKYSFADHPYSKTPMHVWVICRFSRQWLLTEHPQRGLEFPGGKVEQGETAEEAARREVYEETGATVSLLQYVGQYKVEGKSGKIVKNVYFATIDQIRVKNDYHETNGPIFLFGMPNDIRENKKYSFMMKDDVLLRSMEYILRHFL